MDEPAVSRQVGRRMMNPARSYSTHRLVTRLFMAETAATVLNLRGKKNNSKKNLRCNILKAIYLIFLVHLQFKFIGFFSMEEMCILEHSMDVEIF